MALPRELMVQPRFTVDLTRRGVAGVPVFGRYNYTSAQAALSDHSHEGAMEICFLVKGCQTFHVAGRDYRLRGGDVFLTFPDERHSTGGSPSEKSVLYWIAVSTRLRGGDNFLGRNRRASKVLIDALLGLRVRHFRGSWKMKEYFDAIALCHQRPPVALDEVTMTNLVEAFLLEVVRCARTAPDRHSARAITPVLEHIRRSLGEPLSVPDLAARAGLSTARFKVWFKEETGMPPGEYVARLRIEEAIRRLENGKGDITGIAFDLGFSSSQYFATVFKRFTGQRPSARKKPA